MNTHCIIPLHDLVHARSGDKGDRLNVGVFAREQDYFPFLKDYLTEEVVYGIFQHRCPSAVTRYDMPNIHAFNFVLDHALDGGVNCSIGLDGHGKTLSYLLLSHQIKLSVDDVQRLLPAFAQSYQSSELENRDE